MPNNKEKKERKKTEKENFKKSKNKYLTMMMDNDVEKEILEYMH